MLKQRGLTFLDESKALHLLQNISYYRLSGYWYPMLADKTLHTFKPNSTFERAYEIYKFDSELRKLVAAELEKIEVAIRTQVAYTFSTQYDGAWFTRSDLFSNPVRHAQTLTKIRHEYGRSDEQFVTAFKAKYQDPFPPSWITLEITSFGTLSIFVCLFCPLFGQKSHCGLFRVIRLGFHLLAAQLGLCPKYLCSPLSPVEPDFKYQTCFPSKAPKPIYRYYRHK